LSNDAPSPIAILSDQIDSFRRLGALTGPHRRKPSGNLRAAYPRTFRDQAPRFLLHRHASKPRLKPETVGDPVVQIANDYRGHDASVLGYRR